MTEIQIERRLNSLVKERGGLCLKFISPGNAGVPDRVVVLPGGRVVFVELKTERGRLAAVQKWRRAEFEKRGAEVRVLKGPGDVDKFVEEVMPL